MLRNFVRPDLGCIEEDLLQTFIATAILDTIIVLITTPVVELFAMFHHRDPARKTILRGMTPAIASGGLVDLSLVIVVIES